ncbi:MAG: DCC1-like thiol-disulfide oxidoreductase family protein [Paenisporosarcina sp.]
MNLPTPILFYDGNCGFCQQSVQFVLKNEKSESVFFAPLQSSIGNEMKNEYPEFLTTDSIILFDKKEIFIESDAVLALASYLKKPYSLAKYGRIVPKFVLDGLYRLLAKHRHRLINSNESCLLPTPQQKKRFLS